MASGQGSLLGRGGASGNSPFMNSVPHSVSTVLRNPPKQHWATSGVDENLS